MPEQSVRVMAQDSPLVRAAWQIMDTPRHVQAAIAWIRHEAPELAYGVPRDDGGVVLHFILFGHDPHYWQGLCRLFRRFGMDGGPNQ